MSYEERNAWFYGATAVCAYVLYWILLLPLPEGVGLEDAEYERPLLIAVGVAIGLGILGGIVLGMFVPKGAPRVDVRDRDVSRLGGRVASGAVTAGAIAALVLALYAAAPFWTANAVYLGFVLAAVASAAARIVAYRTGAGI